jgi:hypothetical protein
VLWVRAQSGGISTNEIAPFVTANQKAWVIQSGTSVDARLILRETPLGSGHWTWEPNQDMPYREYHEALLAANGLFT